MESVQQVGGLGLARLMNSGDVTMSISLVAVSAPQSAASRSAPASAMAPKKIPFTRAGVTRWGDEAGCLHRHTTAPATCSTGADC